MRPPDLGVPGLRAAWRINRDRALAVGPEDWKASLAGWVLECRGDSIAWWYWSISVVHLRPLPGVPPAKLQYGDAQYEIVSASLDPKETDPVGILESGGMVAHLKPLDFVIQLHGVDDAGAVRAADRCIEECVRGMLSPDTMWKSAWKTILGANGAKFGPPAHEAGHA